MIHTNKKSKMSKKKYIHIQKSIGLPPGYLEHPLPVDEKYRNKLIVYNPSSLKEFSISPDKKIPPLKGVKWLQIEGRDKGILNYLSETLDIHDLTLEDIIHKNQQPRLDLFQDYAVLFLDFPGEEEHRNSAALIIKKDWVISIIDSGSPQVFSSVQERLVNPKSRIRGKKEDYLFYSLADIIIDMFYPVLQKIGEDLESLEERSSAGYTQEILRELHQLNRRIVLLRRLIRPGREALRVLEHVELIMFRDRERVFLKDVIDHAGQISDQLELYREIHDSIYQLEMSHANHRMNGAMRMLTLISTIFIPLNFLAGIYGMNFKYMPGLDSNRGFIVMLGLMAALSGFMIFFLRGILFGAGKK